jgi:lysophospholipase L1-like esterase
MRTLMLGDSLTAWNDWQKAVGTHLNHGVPGDTTADLLRRIPRALSTRPDRIVLLIGTNDVIQGVPMETLTHHYTQILSELLECEALFVLSVPPLEGGTVTAPFNTAICQLNDWIREQMWKYGFSFVDLHAALQGDDGTLDPTLTTDGVHLSEAGYRRFGQLLAEAFELA